MKYCTKCGNQMSDEMNFCQKCGTAVNSAPTEQPASPPPPSVQASSPVYLHPTSQQPPMYHYQQAPRHNAGNNKPRTGMKVAAIIFLCFGCFWILMGIIGQSIGFGVGFSMPSFALALIFFLYYKTPKTSAEGKFYIRGKATLPKVITIIAIMMFGLVSCSVIAFAPILQSTTPKTNETSSTSTNATASSSSSAGAQKVVLLNEVTKWYESNAGTIATATIDFIPLQVTTANAGTTISGVVITENSFEFSELLGCAYFIYFDCTVDGVACHGHASAFVEYLGDEITWIDLEISTDADWTVLVEWFDDEAEAKSYDYYNTLIEMYGKQTP